MELGFKGVFFLFVVVFLGGGGGGGEASLGYTALFSCKPGVQHQQLSE